MAFTTVPRVRKDPDRARTLVAIRCKRLGQYHASLERLSQGSHRVHGPSFSSYCALVVHTDAAPLAPQGRSVPAHQTGYPIRRAPTPSLQRSMSQARLGVPTRQTTNAIRRRPKVSRSIAEHGVISRLPHRHVGVSFACGGDRALASDRAKTPCSSQIYCERLPVRRLV
jgi:hypothetical protein